MPTPRTNFLFFFVFLITGTKELTKDAYGIKDLRPVAPGSISPFSEEGVAARVPMW